MMNRPILDEIFEARGTYVPQKSIDQLSLKLAGATIIEPTITEPDPWASREDYYYNSKLNALYRRVIISGTIAKWVRISD